jgi:hypothetical protein
MFMLTYRYRYIDKKQHTGCQKLPMKIDNSCFH